MEGLKGVLISIDEKYRGCNPTTVPFVSTYSISLLGTFGVFIQFTMVPFTRHCFSHTPCIPDPQGKAGTPAATSMLDDANSLAMSDQNTVTPEPCGDV